MHEPPSTQWRRFGSHMHQFEPPDLYVVRLIGDISADDARAPVAALQALAKRTGRGIFALADVRKIGSVTIKARELVAEANRKNLLTEVRATVVFGASFTTRVTLSLVLRALRLLQPETYTPYAFVDTEAEARAFLDEQRKRSAQ